MKIFGKNLGRHLNKVFAKYSQKKSPYLISLVRYGDLPVFCRGGRIRTYDLHIPNVARYQATLHPDSYCLRRCKNKEYCEFCNQILIF
jgi:hypothetical protein